MTQPVEPKREAPVRVAITRMLFRLIESVAIEKNGPRVSTGPDAKSDNIPGSYTDDEWEALRAIWRRGIRRDVP